MHAREPGSIRFINLSAASFTAEWVSFFSALGGDDTDAAQVVVNIEPEALSPKNKNKVRLRDLGHALATAPKPHPPLIFVASTPAAFALVSLVFDLAERPSGVVLVKTAAEALRVLGREDALLPMDATRDGERAPADRALTPAERHALELAGENLANADIALVLGVSVNTVKTHLVRAARKLSCRTRHEALLAARQLGLLPQGRRAVQETGRRLALLSVAELRVLQAMTLGLGNKTIGSALCIAETTVKTHARSIFRKLHVAGRADAVAIFARETGFSPEAEGPA